MPPQMSTTYDQNGTVNTQTSGSVYPAFDPATNPMVAFAYQVARARIANQQAQGASDAGRQAAASRPVVMQAPAPARQEQPVESSGARQARQAEERARIIAADEASRPAPMTYLPSGPGITGGYVMDPRAMDANQRRIFLPQGESFSGGAGGAGGDPGGAGLAGIYADEKRALDADMSRRAADATNYGYGARH